MLAIVQGKNTLDEFIRPKKANSILVETIFFIIRHLHEYYFEYLAHISEDWEYIKSKYFFFFTPMCNQNGYCGEVNLLSQVTKVPVSPRISFISLDLTWMKR